MKLKILLFGLLTVFVKNLLAQAKGRQQTITHAQLVNAFQHPPEAAKPWVFWYWLNGAVSAEGITADLEAMKYAGIAGAYLMPIKDTLNPPIYQPTARQLSSPVVEDVKACNE